MGRDAGRDGGCPNLGTAMEVGPLRLRNRVVLAPLSGITDVPFRALAASFGAGLVVSEMVASAEFAKGSAESRMRAMPAGRGVVHAVQLAGRDPHWMAEAARRLVDGGVDLIDINFGCPAKKVVGGQSGSALMREPDLAARMVEATVKAAGAVPVSVKMRLGWDRGALNAGAMAADAERAGAVMVTVHGRTRCQFYEGRADWSAIGAVKAAVSIPVVANGDLVEPEQAEAMLRASRADAVMIGRGSQGRPWLPGLVGGAVTLPDLDRIDLGTLVCGHYAAMLDHYGVAPGLRHARKHVGWYLGRFAAIAGGDAARRERAGVMTSTDAAHVSRTLRRMLAGVSAGDLERLIPSGRVAEAA